MHRDRDGVVWMTKEELPALGRPRRPVLRLCLCFFGGLAVAQLIVWLLR